MSDNLEIDRLIADIERRQDRESALIDRLHETRTELAALRARIDGAATGEVWKHDCIGGQSASHIVLTRAAAEGLCPFGRVALVPLDD